MSFSTVTINLQQRLDRSYFLCDDLIYAQLVTHSNEEVLLLDAPPHQSEIVIQWVDEYLTSIYSSNTFGFSTTTAARP